MHQKIHLKISHRLSRTKLYKNVLFSTKQYSVTPGQTAFNENKKLPTALTVTLEIKSSDVLLLLETLHISAGKYTSQPLPQQPQEKITQTQAQSPEFIYLT